ncbi:hypothetical protein C7M84_024217 [Penaeus vannamei]|uniref:Uncharacterized protein n=1 Tax=Penaeus vannamei TaxID=6689 RepID=A0A423U1N4_PENVA|nr:hypothetical protein C7M84_024217 [Penaeus vannamei]
MPSVHQLDGGFGGRGLRSGAVARLRLTSWFGAPPPIFTSPTTSNPPSPPSHSPTSAHKPALPPPPQSTLTIPHHLTSSPPSSRSLPHPPVPRAPPHLLFLLSSSLTFPTPAPPLHLATPHLIHPHLPHLATIPYQPAPPPPTSHPPHPVAHLPYTATSPPTSSTHNTSLPPLYRSPTYRTTCTSSPPPNPIPPITNPLLHPTSRTTLQPHPPLTSSHPYLPHLCPPPYHCAKTLSPPPPPPPLTHIHLITLNLSPSPTSPPHPPLLAHLPAPLHALPPTPFHRYHPLLPTSARTCTSSTSTCSHPYLPHAPHPPVPPCTSRTPTPHPPSTSLTSPQLPTPTSLPRPTLLFPPPPRSSSSTSIPHHAHLPYLRPPPANHCTPPHPSTVTFPPFARLSAPLHSSSTSYFHTHMPEQLPRRPNDAGNASTKRIPSRHASTSQGSHTHNIPPRPTPSLHAAQSMPQRRQRRKVGVNGTSFVRFSDCFTSENKM